jgi:hypothetical protein
VRRVALAPAAVLPELNPVWIVPLALIRLVIPALAFLARERDCNPDVSTGHVLSRFEWCQDKLGARLAPAEQCSAA